MKILIPEQSFELPADGYFRVKFVTESENVAIETEVTTEQPIEAPVSPVVVPEPVVEPKVVPGIEQVNLPAMGMPVPPAVEVSVEA